MSKPLALQDGTGVIVSVPGIGILDAYGTTVPADNATGYATGCLFRHTDGGNGTALYVNEGTVAAADFNAASVA